MMTPGPPTPFLGVTCSISWNESRARALERPAASRRMSGDLGPISAAPSETFVSTATPERPGARDGTCSPQIGSQK